MISLYRHTAGASGAVAAGHPLTVEAARILLENGGNAFDAATGAFFMACVAEPVLASLGGGGFLLGWRAGESAPRLFDFFARTPLDATVPESLDFHPIEADFGGVTQIFHIGRGAIATPGAVPGVCDFHARYGRLPLREVLAPAIEAAREGVVVNAMQAYAFRIVQPIYLATEEAARTYGSPSRPGEIIGEGEILHQLALADTLEALGRVGPQLFVDGEVGQGLTALCREGGWLRPRDLREYRVEIREPLSFGFRDYRIWTNPPPSSGGVLIAFGLRLLERLLPEGCEREADCLPAVADALRLTDEARREYERSGRVQLDPAHWLDAAHIERHLARIRGRPRAWRGTTHISILDGEGNAASLTTSNGEGCGHMIPGTGVMPNNMLGEEDINPGGFHRWKPGVRLSSMMSPTIALGSEGECLVLGSGGSNRIRSAILQVLWRLIERSDSLQAAIEAPRLHYERGRLDIEHGVPPEIADRLCAGADVCHRWAKRSLFFGGVHVVSRTGKGFDGYGDPRRGGVAWVG